MQPPEPSALTLGPAGEAAWWSGHRACLWLPRRHLLQPAGGREGRDAGGGPSPGLDHPGVWFVPDSAGEDKRLGLPWPPIRGVAAAP